MSDSLTTGSLRRLFRFPFEGPGWQTKILVGSAFVLANSILPLIPGILVGGYVLRVMRQTIDGKEPALPAWDDWGKMLVDGLRMMVINLVYFLPALLVFTIGMGLYFAGTLYLPMAAAMGEAPGEGMASYGMVLTGSMVALFLSMSVGTLLALLAVIALPAATAHFAAEDRLAAAFHLRQWWRMISADKLGYFISLVIVAGLASVLYLAIRLAYYTLVLCCLIPVLAAPLGFFVSLVWSALFGQTYRESKAAIQSSEPEDAVPALDLDGPSTG